MASRERETTTSSQETETYSEAEMSAQAASEVVAIANQQEWAEETVSDIDDLLDEIEQELEEESLVLNFKQKGGQ